jgi:hypothetical protein
MDWLQMRKRDVEFMVKLYKKSTAGQGAVLVFNILGIAWNSYMVYTNGWVTGSFGLGAFIANTLWSMGFVAMNYGELKGAKYEMAYLKKMESESNIKELEEKLERALKLQEGLLKNLKEREKKY